MNKLFQSAESQELVPALAKTHKQISHWSSSTVKSLGKTQEVINQTSHVFASSSRRECVETDLQGHDCNSQKTPFFFFLF